MGERIIVGTVDVFPPKGFSDRVRGGLQRADRNDAFLAVLNSQLLLLGSFRQLLQFKRSQIDVLSQGALLLWHCVLEIALQRRAWLRGVLAKPSWLVQCSVQRASGCSR